MAIDWSIDRLSRPKPKLRNFDTFKVYCKRRTQILQRIFHYLSTFLSSFDLNETPSLLIPHFTAYIAWRRDLFRNHRILLQERCVQVKLWAPSRDSWFLLGFFRSYGDHCCAFTDRRSCCWRIIGGTYAFQICGVGRIGRCQFLASSCGFQAWYAETHRGAYCHFW